MQCLVAGGAFAGAWLEGSMVQEDGSKSYNIGNIIALSWNNYKVEIPITAMRGPDCRIHKNRAWTEKH